MVKGFVLALLFSAALCTAHSASDISDEEVQKTIDQLEGWIQKQTARIESLKEGLGEDPRRLGSLYGDKGQPLYTSAETINLSLDHMWVLICTFMIIFMQAGFAMVEGGYARFRNVQNVLQKNLAVVCMGAIGWWCFGWTWAYSGPYKTKSPYNTHSPTPKDNGWLGYQSFAGHKLLGDRGDGQLEPSTQIMRWYVNMAFALVPGVIASSGVAERSNFVGNSVLSFFMSAWIYPVVVGVTWGGGWINEMNRTGNFDWSGSGIVYMTGGVGALMGAMVSGPRQGRWDGLTAGARMKLSPEAFQPHSMPMIVLGTLILWFGWYGFNGCSTMAMHSAETGLLAAQVAMNTTVAAATGGLSVFILRSLMLKKADAAGFCNGIIVGLVSITAGCSNMETGYAFATAGIGAVLYQMTSMCVRACKIDDVADAFAVYGMGGLWGTMAAAFFDFGWHHDYVHAGQGFKCIKWKPGWVRCWGKQNAMQKDLIAANAVEVAGIFLWVNVHCGILFFVLKVLGLLKGSSDQAEQPFDWTYHAPRRAYELADLPKSSI